MSTPHRILVVGGGYAGVTASLRLASRLGERASIALVSASPRFVERIRLHQLAARGTEVSRPLAPLVASRGIELVVGHAARVDVAAQRLELDGAAPLAWDSLVLATGSAAARPGWALPDDAAIGDEAGARALAARVPLLPAGAAVAVVGGGLSGLELATELAEARPGLAVTLVTPSLGDDLAPRGRAALAAALDALGVRVALGVVAAREPGALLLAGGARVDAALVALATGLRAGPLAAASGLRTDELGRAHVDGLLRAAGAPRVRVAGDAARTEAPLRMACATALPMACHAADALAAELLGREARAFGFSYYVRCTSLGRRRGLIQRTSPDDRPLPRVFTGWTGARLKEAVCRYPMATLFMERALGPTYRWPGMHGARLPSPAPAPAALEGGAA